eukprot:CAMPEP_0206623504 /NCGR_PEP_ID=MMETSP0325_2-20121206/63514_1 /ASSEMBLY_ACC=CAM_ASM_000347 /TAXON_ID=2866 /ORGANISM="Crypthecodinium cohnii, Strain Seligo" /LENGTH=37 /DNA_ID= /DNA_START= /DNA_END= /DNA_ORIENTATION=
MALAGDVAEGVCTTVAKLPPGEWTTANTSGSQADDDE